MKQGNVPNVQGGKQIGGRKNFKDGVDALLLFSQRYFYLCGVLRCKLNFSHNGFDVIDSGKNDFETTVKEAVHMSS